MHVQVAMSLIHNTALEIVSAEGFFALSTGFMTNACQYPILALYYSIAQMYLGCLTEHLHSCFK